MRVHVDSSIWNNFQQTQESEFEKYLGFDFIEFCRMENVTVCCSAIACMEFSRKQQDNLEIVRNRLESAKRLLTEYGVKGDLRTNDLEPMSLQNFFESRGIEFKELEVQMESYDDAAHRCALHMAPVDSKKTRDEMRDAVIWHQAILDSRANEGVVLLSNDDVHTCEAAQAEAKSEGFEVYKQLDVLVSSRSRAREFIEHVEGAWGEIQSHFKGALPKAFVFEKLDDIHYVKDGDETKIVVSLEIAGVDRPVIFTFVRADDGLRLTYVTRIPTSLGVVSVGDVDGIGPNESYRRNLRELEELSGINLNED